MGNQTTIFPALVDVDIARTETLLANFTSYMVLVSNFSAELATSLAFENSQYAGDFVSSMSTALTEIDSKKSNLDAEFLYHYIRQYERAVQAVKDVIPASSTSLFSDLSDSIGCLYNVVPTLNDTVIPLNDISGTVYTSFQICPSTLTNKISPTAKDVAKSMSRYATTLYRSNLVNVQVAWAQTTDAHGSNLITDFNAYLRMRDIAPLLVKKLNKDFDALFKMVTYFCTLNDFSGYNAQDPTMNLQALPHLQYTADVEHSRVQFDLLGKKINSARHATTIKRRLWAPTAAGEGTVSDPANTIILAQTPTSSTNPVPKNSTAVNVPKPTTAKTIPPAVERPPTATAAAITTVQTAATVKQTIQSPDVANDISAEIHSVPRSAPQFKRDAYAFATESPIPVLEGARDLVCRLGHLASLSLKALGNLKTPKLPAFYKNFKFKNVFTTFAVKLEKQIVKRLLALIPPLPTVPNLKKIFTNFAKKLFTCNPTNWK